MLGTWTSGCPGIRFKEYCLTGHLTSSRADSMSPGEKGREGGERERGREREREGGREREREREYDSYLPMCDSSYSQCVHYVDSIYMYM